MSDARIFSSAVFGKWKQEARSIKRTGIPHHQALEQVAIAKGFNNWHQVVTEAKQNLLSEQAYRSGVVVAYDIKDAMEHWASDSLFVDDHRVAHFCEQDVFLHYLASDEEESGEAPIVTDEYREQFRDYFFMNIYFFRFCGELPASPKALLPLLEKRCFFPPEYIWFVGKCVDPWKDLAVDGRLDMSGA